MCYIYGETALRILYGLDRFSEDLDFTLLKSEAGWRWSPYEEAITSELASFGFQVTFIKKEKREETAIQSAFLKTQTVQELLKVAVHSGFVKGIHLRLKSKSTEILRFPFRRKI